MINKDRSGMAKMAMRCKGGDFGPMSELGFIGLDGFVGYKCTHAQMATRPKKVSCP